jgi:DNA end-binding protein Ku
MVPAVWNGLLRFGLLTIPVKLYRAAQAEKVRFRQVNRETGARVRHTLRTDTDRLDTTAPASREQAAETVQAKRKPAAAQASLSDSAAATVQSEPLSRRDLAKGYEFEKGRYVCLNSNELAGLLPPTAREIDVREFVNPVEIEPVFIDSTFFVVPDRAGQRAYALLLEALCGSGLVGVAQIAMHSRESVLVLRPCANSIIAQTLFYEAEIRRERHYRVDRSLVAAQELTLALRLIEERTMSFEPLEYFDAYREAVQALVRSRIEGQQTAAVGGREAGEAAGTLLQALEQSLKRAEPNGRMGTTLTAVPRRDRKQPKVAAS